MTLWERWRRDVARPEAPVAGEERRFLAISAAVIVVAAQLTDPGAAGELLLVVVAGVALALRGVLTRAPAEAFGVVIAASVGVAVGRHGHLELAYFLGVMLTLYASWHLRSATRAALVAVVGAASPVLVAVIAVDDLGWSAWLSAHAFTSLLGRSLRRQRDLIEQLEAAREALAEQAVAEERRRIARELHDLAGHTLAAVLLHVTGARHVLRRDVDEAERALRDAEEVGRASLDQIRATVAQLRTSERGTEPSVAGAGDIPHLVEEYRRAGIAIDVDLAEPALRVVGPVGTALHRIAREALANVARHAPGNAVRLALDVDRRTASAHLVVSDHGRPAAPADGSGRFGLVGMRERAVALGGRFEAGPTRDGWRVEAEVPLVADDRAAVAAP